MNNLATQTSEFLDGIEKNEGTVSMEQGDYVRMVMAKFNLNWPDALHYFNLWLSL